MHIHTYIHNMNACFVGVSVQHVGHVERTVREGVHERMEERGRDNDEEERKKKK